MTLLTVIDCNILMTSSQGLKLNILVFNCNNHALKECYKYGKSYKKNEILSFKFYKMSMHIDFL